MKLSEFILHNRKGVYRKGTHRDISTHYTGKESPTPKQRNRGKWRNYEN